MIRGSNDAIRKRLRLVADALVLDPAAVPKIAPKRDMWRDTAKLIAFARQHDIALDWLSTGQGSMFQEKR